MRLPKERTKGALTLTAAEARALIEATTQPEVPALLPEIPLRCARGVIDLGRYLKEHHPGQFPEGFYWAFPWTGGQLLARHLLDNPDLVAGKRVLDFACGSGLIGIAAAKAGASGVELADIDPIARVAAALNCEDNGVAATIVETDLIETDRQDDGAAPWDLIVVGDIYYHDLVAPRATAWFQSLTRRGATVLIGDPGRSFLPRDTLELVKEAPVEPHPAIASVESGRAWIWQVMA